MDDINLSEHYSLFDLTTTNRAEYQAENRNINGVQIQTLRNVAGLLEVVNQILLVNFTNPFKMIVTSGYRCKPLNDAVGSTDRSQHMKCEAADCIPQGLELSEAFRVLWKEVSEGRLPVGQLIFETDERQYGTPSWIHISLGSPWRDQSKCNQVLRMEHGKYSLLGKL